MVVQEKLLTIEEFAALPDDGRKYELVRGVLVEKDAEMPGAKPIHNILASLIVHFLFNHILPQDLGIVSTELGCVLSTETTTVRFPDVAFVSKARLPQPDLTQYIPIAPDLAIEIVSPNDTANEVAAKVMEYLQAGTVLVWVIYTDLQTVYVHQSNNDVRIVDINGTLDGGDVMPGFKLALRELFKGLTQE
jgi:Uma2 family endonuclease